MIPLVVASERGLAQTNGCHGIHWGCRTTLWDDSLASGTIWKVRAIDGDSPVHEASGSVVVS